MQLARHLLAQRRIAALICVATLLLKLLIPTGYMIERDHGRITFTLCSGVAPHVAMAARPGMRHDLPAHAPAGEHDKADAPCAFVGLFAASLGAIDPIQLGALIAFVMGAAFVPAASLPPVRRTYRPPSRAPPTVF